MTFSGHDPHLFRWKGKKSAEKMHLKNGDIDRWRKQVETASEFALSEVFSRKKPHLGSPDLAVPLQSSAQLQDHDEAYSEAQALLGDWLHSKLRLELEMDEDDDLYCPAERSSPPPSDICLPPSPDHCNFDDFYNCLNEEDESSAINNFLQELMERELTPNLGPTRNKLRNPRFTIEARHQQVRKNKARREAERQRQREEKEMRKEAREEARRQETRRQETRRREREREEALLQQEVVRLRRRREEERCVRQREREREQREKEAKSKNPPPNPAAPQQLEKNPAHLEERLQTQLYLRNIQSLQRHFSGWMSVVLKQRLLVEKAGAVCEWRRRLKVWRAWRALVRVEKQQREVQRTNEELRAQNRRWLVAVQSDDRRLLRRCLLEWLQWSRAQRHHRDVLSRQQETRRKMEAFIRAAAESGKLRTPDSAEPETQAQTGSGSGENHSASISNRGGEEN